jgi:hypothetical protein
MREPLDPVRAGFEAGIKLGGIFHQFVGTPVSPATAPDLARAIERAVALQPYVESIRVHIDPRRGGPSGRGRFGYRYLTAPMLEVDRRVRLGRARARARLRYRPDLRYPLMELLEVRSGPSPKRGATRASRKRDTPP